MMGSKIYSPCNLDLINQEIKAKKIVLQKKPDVPRFQHPKIKNLVDKKVDQENEDDFIPSDQIFDPTFFNFFIDKRLAQELSKPQIDPE